MNTYNDIGIDSQLDWKRIRKLLMIGIFAAVMVLVGDENSACIFPYGRKSSA